MNKNPSTTVVVIDEVETDDWGRSVEFPLQNEGKLKIKSNSVYLTIT
ncbi:tautomerase family protein [Bartonella saheliensis]